MFCLCLPMIFGTAWLFLHVYPNVQYVPHYSVIHGERQPPRTALHACIEELCLHW